ncbi:MAG: hypothetical protein AAGC60_21425 [Acidobacteriota bacterium]
MSIHRSRVALSASLIAGLVLALAAASPVRAGTLETLLLPEPSPGQGLYYPDVQASFPGVDWQTLDRLYLPAGHWKFLRLGNLPQRTPGDELVITNHGGQVRVGGLGHYYNFVVGGGSHWILSGRSDPASGIGDAAFPGHAEGYAHSRDRYGILIDDAFESEGESGLAVGGGATAYTIEFLEVREVGFAGLLLKTDDDGDAHMDDVTLRDLYIHDVGSEGIYLGSTQSAPQHKFRRLEIVNNRIVRTGTEALQVGQLADGSTIHHNVIAFGAIDWKNPFQNFQDNNTQYATRGGDTSVHHNLVVGGASHFLILFGQDRAGDPHDPSHVAAFEDNYFSHVRNVGVYVHSSADATTTYRFARNAFRAIDFQYDELDPGATNHQRVFRIFNVDNPIELVDNRWQGSQQLYAAAGSNVVATGNVNEAIPAVHFVDWGLPAGFDPLRLETWTDVTIHGDPVVYTEGDIVSHLGDLYLNVEPGTHTNKLPPDHPITWQPLPPPADDYRLAPTSPFQGLGLLDVVSGVVFADGFERGDLTAWSASTD